MNENINNPINKAMEPAVDIIEAAEGKTTKGAAAVVVACVAGLMTAATLIVGGVKFGAKVLKEQKAKKELRQPDDNNPVEVTDEMVEEATK